MVEVEGMINQTPVTILIDPGASLSYIAPKMVEKCKLSVEKFENSWLVQLATSAKRKVTCFVNECVVVMDHFETVVKLNVLPLGSYDLLIGMDWLEQHRVILNCYDKTFTCLNSDRKPVSVKGTPRKTTIRQIFSLQLKRAVRKGYKVYAVTVTDEESLIKTDKLKLEDIPVLKEYIDVFLEEIPGLPPKRELDFTIELVPGAVPSSKAPYRMNILELNELKSQLKELIDKKYIQPSVSP